MVPDMCQSLDLCIPPRGTVWSVTHKCVFWLSHWQSVCSVLSCAWMRMWLICFFCNDIDLSQCILWLGCLLIVMLPVRRNNVWSMWVPRSHLHSLSRTYTRAHTHAHNHTHLRVHTRTYVHTHTSTHTYPLSLTHTHAHIHTHTLHSMCDMTPWHERQDIHLRRDVLSLLYVTYVWDNSLLYICHR